MLAYVFGFTIYFCCFFTECRTSVVMGNLRYELLKLDITLCLIMFSDLQHISVVFSQSVLPVLLWGIYDIDSLN